MDRAKDFSKISVNYFVKQMNVQMLAYQTSANYSFSQRYQKPLDDYVMHGYINYSITKVVFNSCAPFAEPQMTL